MIAEYKDMESSTIIVRCEENEVADIDTVVGEIICALSNAIDFDLVVSPYYDEYGFEYHLGEFVTLGNDYGYYPFAVDEIAFISEYEIDSENIRDILLDGYTEFECR